MTLSTRNLIILDFLSKTEISSIKEIAEMFTLSESSVRYELKNINFILEATKVGKIEFLSKGTIKCKLEVEDYFSKIENSKWQYVLTSEERIKFLKIYILLGSYPFNMQKIIEKLDITRNTLKSDLEKVKKDFLEFGIEINSNFEVEKNKSITYILMPLNSFIRKIILKDKVYFYLSKIIINNALKNVKIEKLNIIIKYVKEVLKESSKILSDESYSMLITYVSVIVEIASNGNKICIPVENETFYKTKEEYKVLNSKKYILEEGFNIKLNNEEMINLTNYYLGSQTYVNEVDFYENWVRSEIFIEKFINKVSEKSGFNMKNDSILFKGLLNHLKPAIYRIKNNINLGNSIYEELIKKEKVLFDIVKNTITETNELKNISNDEIAYLTVYFKASIERIKSEKNRQKRILIICNFGYGTSKLLAQSLKEIYDIDIKGIIPFYELEKYKNFNGIDCIISTSNFEHSKYNVPIIKINPILDKEDYLILDSLNFPRNKNKISLKKLMETIKDDIYEDKINEVVKKLKVSFKEVLIDDFIEEKQLTLKELLPIERIILMEEEKDWKNAIRIAGNMLVRDNCVLKTYIDDTIKVVENNGTYMIINNMYGVFHAKNNNGNVKKSGLSVLILKNSIKIKDKSTNIILILSSKDGHEHLNGLVEFSKILENEEKILEIINCSSEKEIYKILIK